MPKLDLNMLNLFKCKGCDKICYSNIQEARTQAKHLSDLNKQKYNAYFCNICGYYHVGHSSNNVQTHEDEDWWLEYKYKLNRK